MTPADLKNLEVLEQKIKRTVDLVGRLKSENARLNEELSSLKASAATGEEKARELESMKLNQEQLNKQVSELRAERQTVLERVDGLLADLAALPLD